MADSIRERIVQDVVSTLEGIRVSNGFDLDVQSVLRARLPGVKVQEFPTILVVEQSETKDQPATPGGLLGKWAASLSVALICWVRHEEMAREANRLLANVEKALMADLTRGGLAVLTNLVSNEMFVTEDIEAPKAGITVVIEVRYRHAEQDPFLS